MNGVTRPSKLFSYDKAFSLDGPIVIDTSFLHSHYNGFSKLGDLSRRAHFIDLQLAKYEEIGELMNKNVSFPWETRSEFREGTRLYNRISNYLLHGRRVTKWEEGSFPNFSIKGLWKHEFKEMGCRLMELTEGRRRFDKDWFVGSKTETMFSIGGESTFFDALYEVSDDLYSEEGEGNATAKKRHLLNDRRMYAKAWDVAVDSDEDVYLFTRDRRHFLPLHFGFQKSKWDLLLKYGSDVPKRNVNLVIQHNRGNLELVRSENDRQPLK